MTRVLFFANVPTSNPRSIGGATVLSKRIFEFFLKNSNIAINHFQIRSFWRPKFQLIDYVLWIIKFPFIIQKYDAISIHATKDMHFLFMPVLITWIKLFKKKYYYHFFAGNFHKQLESKSNFHQKLIIHTVLKANVLFFETKEMVNYFQNLGYKNCVWIPNSRKPQTIKKRTFTKKFVFISRVVTCKGVNEIIEIIQSLPKDYLIDFYGPLDSKNYSLKYFQEKNISYKGIIKSDNVVSVLNNYDVLLLPTYCYGEGYPGVIIEALSLGIPVITTRFNSIPEIIQHNYNGCLIPVKNSKKLIKAITSFDDESYLEYSKNALESFKHFNSDYVFNKFIDSYLND
jgi:glycosyltransferase involved in cell wall biosynthesis